MIERREMETKITPEKKRELEKLFAKFLVKNLWTGTHHALLLMAMMFIMVMTNVLYFGNSSTVGIFGSALIWIFVLLRMNKILAANFKEFDASVKSILNK